MPAGKCDCAAQATRLNPNTGSGKSCVLRAFASSSPAMSRHEPQLEPQPVRMVNSATVLMESLQKNPVLANDVEEVIEQRLESHICRCTGYVRYYAAVRDVIVKTPGLTTGKRTREVVNHG